MATQLITRITPGPGATVKGELLTNVETDANFLSLNINKLERGNNLADLTDVAAARAALNVPSRSGGGGIVSSNSISCLELRCECYKRAAKRDYSVTYR